MLKWENPVLLSLNPEDQARGANCVEGSVNTYLCNPGARAVEKCVNGTAATGNGCLPGSGDNLD